MNQPQPAHIPGKPPEVEILEIATGHFRSQAVCVAAELGIADLLKDGPKTSDELAKATGAHPRSLYRLMRALAGIGVFAEREDGAFVLTPLAAALQRDSPNSVLKAALLGNAKFHRQSWDNLKHSMMTGESAFEHVHGMELFEYLSRNPEAAEVYDGWMTRLSELQIPALVDSYPYGAFRTIVDVGGGRGALLSAILKANPAANGILFDRPAVVAAAAVARDPELKDRCSVVGGDMFESVAPGGDLYILKTVIHDWSDELSVRILRNCRRAMLPESRLLLIESVVPAGNEPHMSKFMDLNMLVLTHGGLERTEAEYRTLFEDAGLTLARAIATRSPMTLLEGVPAV